MSRMQAIRGHCLHDRRCLGAEWFMEGLLHRLLDKYDPVARKCLQQAVFYVVSPRSPHG